MLNWLTVTASLFALCAALPSPAPAPAPITYTSRKYTFQPVRAEITGLMATLSPRTNQRDYIFVFNGYDNNNKLIRQAGCWLPMERTGRPLCLDVGSIYNKKIETGPYAYESLDRFRDFLFNFRDEAPLRYRVDEFQTQMWEPKILSARRNGLDLNLRVGMPDGAFSSTIPISRKDWTDNWVPHRGDTQFMWNPTNRALRRIEADDYFKSEANGGEISP